jgi:hypothetical protein
MAGSHAGRPASWLAVVVIFSGFLISGLGLVAGPSWIAFWIGAAVVVIGGILAAVVDIFSDVVVDEPRIMPEGSGAPDTPASKAIQA